MKEGREEEQREEQGAEEETGCNRTCRQESGGAFTIRSRVFSGATLRSFASQDLPSPPSPSLPRPLHTPLHTPLHPVLVRRNPRSVLRQPDQTRPPLSRARIQALAQDMHCGGFCG